VCCCVVKGPADGVSAVCWKTTVVSFQWRNSQTIESPQHVYSAMVGISKCSAFPPAAYLVSFPRESSQPLKMNPRHSVAYCQTYVLVLVKVAGFDAGGCGCVCVFVCVCVCVCVWLCECCDVPRWLVR